MNSTITPLLFLVIVVILGLVTIAYFVHSTSTGNTKFLEDIKRQEELITYVANRYAEIAPASKKLTDIVEEKKDKFLTTPNIDFHFADAEKIKNYYNDYFKEPTIASLVSEITGELSGEASVNVPKVLETKFGGKDISKWISTIKLPETPLTGMFLRYQRETIKSGQVTLGIEEVDIELNELQAFEKAIENLKDRFGLQLDDSQVNKHRTQLKAKAAKKTLTKLEQVTGWVLIEGRFKIEGDDSFYKCTYVHPVNDYLFEAAVPVTLSASIPKDLVESSYKGPYSQSQGRLIPMKIYGKVWEPIDTNRGIWELQLTPLAIY